MLDIVDHAPILQSDVCRNTAIKVQFNHVPTNSDISLKQNIRLYESHTCEPLFPEVAGAAIQAEQSWFKKIILNILAIIIGLVVLYSAKLLVG